MLHKGKRIVGHRNFSPWLDTLNINARMAQHYMSIADFADEHGSDAVEGLSIAAAAMLAAPSTPDDIVADAIHQAKNGQPMSASLIKDRIKATKVSSEVVDHDTVRDIDEAEISEIVDTIKIIPSEPLRRMGEFLERADYAALKTLGRKIREFLTQPTVELVS
jgi:hypothetical protein